MFHCFAVVFCTILFTPHSPILSSPVNTCLQSGPSCTLPPSFNTLPPPPPNNMSPLDGDEMEFSCISDKELTRRLKDFGNEIIPVTPTSRPLLLKRLARLEKRPFAVTVSDATGVSDEEKNEEMFDASNGDEPFYNTPPAGFADESQPASGSFPKRSYPRSLRPFSQALDAVNDETVEEKDPKCKPFSSLHTYRLSGQKHGTPQLARNIIPLAGNLNEFATAKLSFTDRPSLEQNTNRHPLSRGPIRRQSSKGQITRKTACLSTLKGTLVNLLPSFLLDYPFLVDNLIVIILLFFISIVAIYLFV